MSEEVRGIVERMTLLEPKPGDVVVFHVRDGLNAQEFDEFSQHLKPLSQHCPGVLFTVAERVDDITVVRPGQQATAKEGDVTDGQ